MEIIDNKRIKKDFDYARTVDIREVLSRKVVDTTVNKIIFRVKEIKGKKSDIWCDFVDNINQNNMLERIIRSDIKMKSKFGRTYVGFDIWRDKLKIWIADNSFNNQSLRINGLEQYAVVVDRTYATYNGGAPILKNQLVLTQKNISYLFIGGLGITNNETIGKLQDKGTFKENKENAIANWIPVNWAQVKIPQYIVDNFKIGTHNHNYGVLPCVEMLNKELIDTDAEGIEPNWENKASDVFFSDWYPAEGLINIYNDFVRFFYEELELDHTRVIGMFSNQDMNAFQKIKNGVNSIFERLKLEKLENENDGERNILKKKLILKSIGSENNVKVMQTNFRGIEHVQTLENLTTYIFKICGYSWDEQNGSVYENVSQTMNSSKGIYETTKSKISLFERQWGEFFARIAYAYFKNKSSKFNSVSEAYEDFKKNVEFKIISNVLQQENNDWKKIMELKQSDLISTRKAIKDINPELTDDELENEIIEIKEDTKPTPFEMEENIPYFDDHENNPNENPAYDNNGEIGKDE